MPIIEQLVKRGVLDKEKAVQLEYEIKSSGRREEEVLLEKKLVSEDFLFSLKSEYLKIPIKTVSADEVSLKILETIPEESARYYRVIPLDQKENHLDIGMVFPEDPKAREALEFLAKQSKFTYSIFLVTFSNFEELIRKYRSLKEEVNRALEELEVDLKEEKNIESKRPRSEADRITEEAPISKVVAVILRHAVDGKASDIHIEGLKDRVRVRFRLDGILHSSLFLPLEVLPALAARIKILSNLKIDETRIPQDGRFSAHIEARDIDFRVSTFPTSLGEKVAIRILDSGQRRVDFKNLGITGRNLEVINKALHKSFGMILSTGPTGSGKSTTLYAILGLLNSERDNVVTLEDPVEYFMDGVNQSQVRPEIGYDFASGLRYILRQDPDVIMVGEIRDEETASLAIHASLTGHVVLSSLHTSNTIGVIPRLIDMGIKPFLIPPTLAIAISQRLMRKLCGYCAKKIEAAGEIKKSLLKEVENMPTRLKNDIISKKIIYIYKPVGCKRCNNTGYSGRVGVFEILEMTPELAEITIRDPIESKIMAEAKRQGMVTMKQDGVIKVLEGVTSFEEVIRVTEEK